MRSNRTVLTLLVTVLHGASACDGKPPVQPKTKAGPKAKVERGSIQATPRNQPQKTGKVAGRVNREGGANLSEDEVPFTRMSGYIVRGTDESSFRRCGAARVHYTRSAPLAAAKIVQRYRFRAPQLLTPVYFTLMARIVEDTITIGINEYTSIIEVAEVLTADDDKPDCAPPGRGSLVAPR